MNCRGIVRGIAPLAALAGAVVLALASEGCTVQSNSPPPAPATGTLEVDWTVNHTTDSSQCAQGSAATATLTVFNSAGQAVGSYDAPCDAFTVSVTLIADAYYATIRLDDADGNPRTTTADLDTFNIRAGSAMDIPVDFSAASFL